MENTPKTSVVNPVMTTGYKRFSSDKKGEVTTFNNLDSTILGKRLNQGIKEDDSIGEGNAASMLNLFRFAQGVEWVMLFFGLLVSWVSGACIPAMTILFGDLTDTLIRYGAQEVDVISKCFNMTNRTSTDFLNYTVNNKMTGDEFFTEIQKFGVGLSIIACVQFVLSYVMVACLNAAAERQVFRVRNYFLYAVLRQDIGWYDTHESGEFASRTADDITKLQNGIGEKVGMFNFFLSIFVLSIINAFIHGWKLTLVMLAVVPVMVIILGIMSKIQANFSEKQMQAYATAGAIAEESLAAIRTVVAFGGEEIKSKRYDSNLEAAKIAGIKRGMLTAFSAGAVWIILYATYALAFWYGIGLIISGEYIPSTFTIVFFSVFMGAMNMGQTAPYIEAFSQARAAAASIYSIIDRAPFIDSSSEEGLKPESINGLIEFEQISFNYPSRPEVEILENFNMRVNNGETLAIVGESGCGKSTTIQLLQRFYDPQAGAVKLDGCDIRLLNVAWLRNHIGIVGQEPVLFGTSIAENIKYGLDGATQEEVEWAAKEANAHNFIMKLPKKYDTLVGERGAQLSGGQKQRVAIARALIKNPRILLLDEATSALDSESEAVVQAALDKARLGRTTIIIAHRLSTIRNADKIAAFSNGRVAEIGTHEELMAKRGIYFQLATAQIYENAADDYETNMEDEINIDNRNVLERTLSMDSAGSQNEMDKNSSITKITSKEKKISLSEEEEEIENKFRPSLWKVLKQNSPEWKYIVSGCIGAIGMGFSTPVFSLIFGNLMGLLSDCDPNDIRRQSVHYAYIFLIIGAATAVAMFLQVFMFNYAGEYLTQRLRKLTFAAMLKQEVTWYDNAHNSVGVLCSRLSADAASVQGATGSRIGTILQAFCTLGASTIISLVLSWKMALVTICFVPLVLASTYIQRIVIMGKAVVDMDSFDNANKIAIEAISNIRTVASLHKEKTFHTIYMQNLLGPHKSALKRSHLQGAIFGFAQSIPFFAYATSMFYGGYLVLHEGLDYENIFKVSQLLIMGTTMVGNAFAFAPNYSKGMLSAARIFKLLERKPLIDSSVASGLILPENIGCNVVFKNVKFAYPSRPNVQILEGLDLTIPEGKVVALVGSSGCGKSTCMHLLERFYDPISGSVTLENIDITALNIKWLRSQIGIVSQEPVLFNCSIYDNIAYGDNSRDVSKEEIIQAAKKANVHDFINRLPEGYETKVGDKGTQLSGGQKQRIAIARALLKKPKILLLDEATSSLDTESERIVQEALEEAQKGRTCITVAHRLSTIRDADMIAVLHRGKVVEIGSHDQLISLRKHYFRFYKAQNKAHK